MTNRHQHSHGFTLLEVIAIMVIGATLAAIVVPYISTSVSRSTEPIVHLQNTLSAYQVMENIIADYEARRDTAWDNGTTVDLTALQTAIGAAGTQQNNAYGSYTVEANEFIEFDAANTEQSSATTEILKVSIKDASGIRITTLFTDR